MPRSRSRADPWSHPLYQPIVLKDGRRLVTLADARAFMLGLSERAALRPYWQYAGELVLEAATSRGGAPKEAWAQLRRALVGEGLL